MVGFALSASSPPRPIASPAPNATPIPSITRQLIVVTTPHWDSFTGTLYRFTRANANDDWRAVAGPVEVVIGRTGLAWGSGLYLPLTDHGPAKHEGDGRSPAGVFQFGTAFGFAPADSIGPLSLPYRQLTAVTDCVDDSTSSHYNTLVDRDGVARIDWASAEHMREIDPEYTLGVFVNYNTKPRKRGRGSCIFMHVWKGPMSPTDGCTALDAANLSDVVHWLDAAKYPVLVQLPQDEYERRRAPWALPSLSMAY
jgi:D-alanyl-D-alanine dipeptidase